MDDNFDIKTGYRTPDGYFEDFKVRINKRIAEIPLENYTMESATETGNRKNIIRIVVTAVSSAAAVVVLLFGIFFYQNSMSPNAILSNLSSDEIIAGYCGATESQVIDYYYLPVEESTNDEEILDYISNSGNINIYALMEIE